VDIFALTDAQRRFFCAAAWQAADELGVLRDPDAAASYPTRRLGILLEALRREGGTRPADVLVPREGWGRLAEVIRSDRPLPAGELDAFHAHLAEIGKEPARALAARLIEWAEPKTLLDLGGGVGTYARAFAERGGRATVIEKKEVIARAEPGVEFREADIFTVEESGFGVVLLCNVLHLYGKADCARLCARAKRMGRVVVVKDLDRDTPAGIWFAVNMTLYTDEGEVHSTAEILEWLGGGTVEKMGDHVVVRT
jgi:hypothetical protein